MLLVMFKSINTLEATQVVNETARLNLYTIDMR